LLYHNQRQRDKSRWHCLDCGAKVKPRQKRCKPCANIVLAERMRQHIGWKHKPETKEAMRQSWTTERREKARQRAIAQGQDVKWLEAMSKRFAGANNPNWRNGLSLTPYAPGFYSQLKEAIKNRDGFCCLCGKEANEIHHIDYNKRNHHPDNLILLCKHCHGISNFNRDWWRQWFQARITKLKKLGLWRAQPKHIASPS